MADLKTDSGSTSTRSAFSFAEGQVMWVLWLTYGSFYFCRTNIAAAVPGIEADFGYTKAQIGLVLGALKLAYGIGQLINGQLAEKISPRKLLTVGMLVSAALNVAFGMGAALYFLIFIWACNGYFQALGWTPCMRVAANWFPVEKRGRAVGIIGTGYQATAALTYVMAGYSVQWLGWRGAFYVPAAVFALCCLHMLLFLKERPAGNAGENFEKIVSVDETQGWLVQLWGVLLWTLSILALGAAVGGVVFGVSYVAERYGWVQAILVVVGFLLLLMVLCRILEKEKGEKSIWPNITLTLTNPWLWFLAVSLGLLNACRYGFLDWGLVHLIETQGGEIGKSALKYAVLPLGGIAGALLSGWVTDRWFGGRAAPAIMILLLALGVLTLIYSKVVVAGGGLVLPVILLVLIGFCIYGPQVLLVGTAPMDLARGGAAAAAVGFVNFMGYMGAFSGDYVTGRIVDDHGWQVGLKFWAGCAFGAAIISAFLWNRRSGEREIGEDSVNTK